MIRKAVRNMGGMQKQFEPSEVRVYKIDENGQKVLVRVEETTASTRRQAFKGALKRAEEHGISISEAVSNPLTQRHQRYSQHLLDRRFHSGQERISELSEATIKGIAKNDSSNGNSKRKLCSGGA